LQLHFQKRPWDLYLVGAYAICVAIALSAVGAGFVLASILFLFVPGYVLVAFLFPSGKRIGWIERIALSLGLSIAIVPLLGLALNFTPFGLGFAPTVAFTGLFTLLIGLAAYGQRLRLPASERLSATIHLVTPDWSQIGIDRTLSTVLVAIVVIATGTLAYLLVAPAPREYFTEFYILGPDGKASGYPTALNVSQTGTVIMGITNQESASVNYTVRVDLVGVQIAYNATLELNGTVEVNRTTWSWFNITLGDGQSWIRPYSFRIGATGLWKVQFLLIKESEKSSIYRNLHFFVRVI